MPSRSLHRNLISVLRALSGAALLCLLLGVLASPALATPKRTATINLSPVPGQGHSPKVAVTPAGEAVVIWTLGEGEEQIVQSRSKPAGGVWGPTEDLTQTGRASEIELAVNDAGDAVAVWIWQISFASNPVIESATRAAGGAWGATEEISEAGVNAVAPQVALDAGGDVIAVWEFGENPSTRATQVSSRPAGGSWGAPEDLAANGEGANPRVAMDPAGDAVIVWENSKSEYVGESVSRPAGGSWGPVENFSEGQSTNHPQVGFDAAGDIEVSWATSSIPQAVYVASGSVGGSWEPAVELSGPEGGRDPQMALNSQGDATVVWRTPSGEFVLSSSRPAGGAWGGVEDVSGAGEYREYPQVAVDGDGGAVAVWQTYDGSEYVIETASTGPGGTWGASEQISPAGAYAEESLVAVSPAGYAVSVWAASEGEDSIIQTSELEAFQLTVTKSGTGSGTVTSTAGIECGPVCAVQVPAGNTVTLSAKAAAGSEFSGWSGACGGSGACEVTLGESKSVVATFTPVATPSTSSTPSNSSTTGGPSKAGAPAPVGATFRIRKIKHLPGSSKLKVAVTGAGKFHLTGKRVESARLQVSRPGIVYLPVVPNAALKTLLSERGVVHVAVKIQFKGTAGGARTKWKKLSIKLAP